MSENGLPRITTAIAEVHPDSVTIRGLDLVDDMLGKMSFTDAVLFGINGKQPTEAERVVSEAVLVCLMEHGMMPANVVARLAYTAAPDSLQGAVAGGLCTVGSVLLGALEECAHMLQDGLALAESTGRDLDDVAREIASEYAADRRKIPGLGHNIHLPEDPRTARLFEVAESVGAGGRHIALLQAVGRAADESLGRHLPVNADGACGALLSNVGYDWRITRGFALIARSAGLVAHLWEEIQNPVGAAIMARIKAGVDYQPAEA
ncbi:MAG: citrate synthase [Thermoleophilaceae bacterium]|jgi:citrate synthase|nr:citrate synthase [Thermoleophilaceae bacterium]